MSTIKSSAENLTLNADGSGNDIKFQSNGSEVASIDQAGTITATTFTGAGSTPSIVDGGNATAMTINSSEQVGIGKTPVNTLDINHSGGAVVKLWRDSSSGFLQLDVDGTHASIRNDGGLIKFKTGGDTVRASVTDNGICFGTDTAAANALADYEEGTWTPAMKDTSDRALSTNTGSSGAIYVKIGRQVTVTGRITTDSIGAAGGQLMLTGLPFAAYGSSLGGYSGGTVGRAGNLNIASGTNIAFAVTYGQTHCEMTRWDDSLGTTDMQVSEWSADGWIMFCLVYQTA